MTWARARGAWLVAASAAVACACGSFAAGGDEQVSAPDGGAGDAGSSPEASATERGTVLAAQQAGPRSIAATETDVFWTVAEPGAVRRVSIGGGSAADVHTYAGGVPNRLSVTATEIVWSDQGPMRGMRRIVLGQPAVTKLYEADVSAFARVPLGFALIRSIPPSERPDGGYDVRFLDLDGGVSGYGPYGEELYDALGDGSDLYVTRPAAGTIMRFSGADAGAAADPLADAEPDCRGLAANAAGTYWTRFGEGAVRMRDRASGERTTLATEQLRPYGIAADESGVYWLTCDGAVRRYAGGAVRTLASGFTPQPCDEASRWRPIALTSRYVVWLTAGEVRRVDK